MKVCLWSRVAMRVLLEVGSFPAFDADTLYAGARAADLHRFFSNKTTLAVTATTHENPELHHSGFAALKVKDAVVDALRDRMGHRPNVDVKNPTCLCLAPARTGCTPLCGSAASRCIGAATEWPWRRSPQESLAAAVLALGA